METTFFQGWQPLPKNAFAARTSNNDGGTTGKRERLRREFAAHVSFTR